MLNRSHIKEEGVSENIPESEAIRETDIGAEETQRGLEERGEVTEPLGSGEVG